MHRTHNLEFACRSCLSPIVFSLLDLEEGQEPIRCSQCQATYHLEDETLKRQLALFVALCQQVRASKEILADTSVGVDIAGHSVTIPYNLLLTRFTSTLDLTIGEDKVSIRCRVEPLLDLV